MRISIYLPVVLASLAAAGCNAVLGADEPVVMGPDSDMPSVDGILEPPHGSTCGNGILEAEERCDDANDAAGDGCNNCQIECGPFPEQYDDRSGHCYVLRGATVSQSNPSAAADRTWDDAVADCATWNGTLAAVTDVDELAFVQHFMNANESEEVDTWIGGRRVNGQLQWQDPSKDEWLFVSWATDEPDMDGNCIALSGSPEEPLMFMDRDCGVPARYLCERDVVPGEPAAQ